MTALKRLLTASATSAALLATLSSPIAAQQAPAPAASATPAPAASAAPPAGSLTLSHISAGLARLLVSYARMVVDVRYGSLEPDPLRNGIVVRDLVVQGFGPAAGCRVTLKRAGVGGLTLLPAEAGDTRIDVTGLAIANACFGGDAPAIALATGGDTIAVSHLGIDVGSRSGSGAATVNISAVAPGVARLEAAADLDYFSLVFPGFARGLAGGQGGEPGGNVGDDDDTTDDVIPGTGEEDDIVTLPAGIRGTLRAAHVTIEDLGVWKRVGPLLPPGALTPEVIDSLVTAPEGTPSRELEQRVADGVKAFVAEPGQLTAMLRPDAPVLFDTTTWTSPDDALRVAMPVITTALPTPAVTLIAGDTATPGDPRALGLALARGEGVPRNARRATELLAPLADDGEVALALAGLTLADDPAASYGHAMRAAAADVPGALAALDRAEARLPLGAILGAQLPGSTALPDTAFASPLSLRDMALAYEDGDGAPRSYALALRLGLSAGAAGDLPAQALIDRLDARFAADPAWRSARDAAADEAARDWTTQTLATRLKGE